MLHFPKGTRYRAVEKNILKLRAFEMILIIFQVEQLRELVYTSVQNTQDFVRRLTPTADRTGARAVRTEKEAWQSLVDNGILTPSELDKVRSIIDYRNVIAHETARLTVDVNRIWSQRHFRPPDLALYRPRVLERLE